MLSRIFTRHLAPEHLHHLSLFSDDHSANRHFGDLFVDYRSLHGGNHMIKCQLVLYIIFVKHSINTVTLGKQIVSGAFFCYGTAESDLGSCSVY